MARTVTEIKKGMTDRFISEPVIIAAYNLDVTLSFEQQFSVVSIESILFYVFAFAMQVHETLWDILRANLLALLDLLMPHTAKWYAKKATDYLHGVPLLPDSDKFNTSGYSATQLAATKIVKNSAVVEQTNAYGRVTLRIKVARELGGVLEALLPAQLAGLKAYFAKVKDAGVRLQIDSLPADALMLGLKIFYDPLILNSNGERLDGTDMQPIQKAIREFLKNLPFNGIFVLAFLVDALQKVPGVVIPEVTAASAKYGLFPFASISTEYNPDAGYLKLYNESTDLLIQLLPHSAF